MTQIYLPTVTTSGKVPPLPPCGMAEPEARLADLIARHPWQRRKRLTCDARLCRAARAKAAQIATLVEPAHEIGGESPNELVERFGFALGLGSGNSVESLAYGAPEAETVLGWLLASPAHRRHVCGEGDYFRSQDRIGVGYCAQPNSPYTHYFCILIAKEK